MGASVNQVILRIVLCWILLVLSACGTKPLETVRIAPSRPTRSNTVTPILTTETREALRVPTLTPTLPPPGVPVHDWKSILDPILDRGGVWHVLVRGPEGVIYERGSQDVIHPASVIKLAIGMLVVAWLDDEYGDFSKVLSQGPINAGRSYEQLLKAMLVYSEEEATELLQNALVEGYGWKKINQRLVDWGAPHTNLVPRRSSAADTVNLLEGLYERNLPSPAASRMILAYLSEVTKGDTVRIWKLKDILPAGATIYDKRGSLTDPVIVADAGIIRLPDGSSYYLCLYGYPDKKTTFEDLDRLIGDFAVAWYHELSRGQ